MILGAEGLVSKYSWSDGSGEIFGAVAKVIQVVVGVESSASSESDTEEGRADGSRALAEGLTIALGVLEDFVAWMRTEGEQPWMGPSHEPVELVRSDLVDWERGGVVRNVSIPQMLTVVASGHDAAAAVRGVDAVMARVQSRAAVPVAARGRSAPIPGA